MSTTKKAQKKAPRKTLVNVDRLVQTATTAWRKAEDGAEGGRVQAIRPLVGKVAQSTFCKSAGLSSSTVSRYWKVAALAESRKLTAPQVREHAGDLVKAQKVAGGPEALEKTTSTSDLFSVAARLAAQKRMEDTRGGKGRKAGSKKTSTKDTPTTVAQDAERLTARLVAASEGKADAALTRRDMEALSKLASVIAAASAVESIVPKKVRAAKVA